MATTRVPMRPLWMNGLGGARLVVGGSSGSTHFPIGSRSFAVLATSDPARYRDLYTVGNAAPEDMMSQKLVQYRKSRYQDDLISADTHKLRRTAEELLASLNEIGMKKNLHWAQLARRFGESMHLCSISEIELILRAFHLKSRAHAASRFRHMEFPVIKDEVPDEFVREKTPDKQSVNTMIADVFSKTGQHLTHFRTMNSNEFNHKHGANAGLRYTTLVSRGTDLHQQAKNRWGTWQIASLAQMYAARYHEAPGQYAEVLTHLCSQLAYVPAGGPSKYLLDIVDAMAQTDNASAIHPGILRRIAMKLCVEGVTPQDFLKVLHLDSALQLKKAELSKILTNALPALLGLADCVERTQLRHAIPEVWAYRKMTLSDAQLRFVEGVPAAEESEPELMTKEKKGNKDQEIIEDMFEF